MGQSGIATHLDVRTHACEDFRRFLYPLDGDMGIGVARAEEDRSPRERAPVITRGPGRPDQPARERDDSAVPTGMTRNRFANQAGTLREAQQDDLLACYASREQVAHDRL